MSVLEAVKSRARCWWPAISNWQALLGSVFVGAFFVTLSVANGMGETGRAISIGATIAISAVMAVGAFIGAVDNITRLIIAIGAAAVCAVAIGVALGLVVPVGWLAVVAGVALVLSVGAALEAESSLQGFIAFLVVVVAVIAILMGLAAAADAVWIRGVGLSGGLAALFLLRRFVLNP